MYTNRTFKTVGIFLLVLLISVITAFVPRNAPGIAVSEPVDYEDFESRWKSVDSLLNVGLPKSALEIVQSIYTDAQASENHPQFIKSVLYKLRLTSEFDEEFMEKTLTDLKTEITRSKQPATQVLHSIVADLYWRYFQSNRYKFYERTTVVGIELDDIRTWDLKTMMDAIIYHYERSLINGDLLKSVNLADFDAVLELEKDSKIYRPSLYDFLAHRAVDFFMNDESSITQPANRFEMKEMADFAAPARFLEIDYSHPDTLSLKVYALQIFQELVDFHLQDPDPTALVDLNLKRLNFVLENSILSNKDSLYIKALTDFEEDVIEHPASTDVSNRLANAMFRMSLQYKPLVSDDFKWDAKKAAEVCRDAIQRFPESRGARLCGNLLGKIEQPTYDVRMEMESVPEMPSLALLKFRNIEKMYFKILNVEYSEYRKMLEDNRNRNDLHQRLLALPSIQNWSQEVPNDGDYQYHHTEIKIPAMGSGHYVLLSSIHEDFKPDTNVVSYQSFWVTRIGFISQNTWQGDFGIYLMDREKGTALKDVSVKLFYRSYDYPTRSYNVVEGGSFISDQEGFVSIPPLDGNDRPNSFSLEFRMGDDYYVTDDRFYHSRRSKRTDRTTEKVHLFTDRAIYRPGQTVYFKGIVLEKSGDKRSILENHPVAVEFKDVNHQKISGLDLQTNEYGSIQGSFVIPQGLLNGRMTLKTKSGSVHFLVEEYKRPRFEVTFNPVEGSYRLNEEIILTGNARAFAGNDLSDAAVNFRVVREVFYPWRFNYIRYYPVGSTMEITNGTTTTDENGLFSIPFKAIPDHAIPMKYKPAFMYTVYADVTDINNETQSSKTYVRVSSQALQVEIGIGEVENLNDLKEIPIRTTNLNGRPLPASGTMEIALLEEPERLLREQLWQHPDVFVLEKQTFHKEFPNDSYDKENDPANLKTRKVVVSKEFNTESDSIVSLDPKVNFPPGRYRITIKTRDEFGTEVQLEKYVILFNPGVKSPPIRELNWFHVLKKHCEPGEKASFLIGTAEKKVRVLYEVVHKEDVLESQWINLSNEQRLIEIPVTETLRGGFKVNLLFVRHNRVFKNNFGVDVPHTNKKLDFEFVTFRDKLKPGDEEEWLLKIKGKSGDKVAAELMAGMYDASLDKFTGHNWPFHILSYPYHGRNWTTEVAFQNTSGSRSVSGYSYPQSPPIQQYDRLNWFGFNYFGGYNYVRGGRMVTDAMPGQAMTQKVVNMEGTEAMDEEAEEGGLEEESSAGQSETGEQQGGSEGYQVRRDFRETAFFYPQLRTDENGDVLIRFKAPESLTRWKFMGLAHTRDLKHGVFSKELTTAKELMVVPNPPRFFREKDSLQFTSKVVNLSEEVLRITVELEFFNSITGEDISKELMGDIPVNHIQLDNGGFASLSWPIRIPEQYNVITYRIVANADMHSDGEEKPVPVLSNRMLVTESLPLPMKGNETRQFSFKKLVNSGGSASLKNHRLTLEFSSNPAWYAVQALPYLIEYNNESADDIFNRFYANSLAAFIVESNPKIAQVLNAWKEFSPDAFLSNLEKNPELKALVLEETPWVRDAKDESERKRRIALLFDFNRMGSEKEQALYKLVQKQSPGGGWSWYKGMPDNRNITQQIVTGFGHLKQLGVFDAYEDQQTRKMINKAIRYLDSEVKEDHDWLLSHKSDLSEMHIGNLHTQYFYARSFFNEAIPVSKSNAPAYDYYYGQLQEFWTKFGIYQKGMASLALHRNEDLTVAQQILASLKEYALHSDEMGMYWRSNAGGYYWYQAPIETQALLIEAFHEVANDQESVEKMKVWLLKQKQTQDWKTARATADAVYALLLRGGDWLAVDQLVEIQLGDETIDPMKREDTRVEAGTGYFKTSWDGQSIDPQMGKVKVTNPNTTIAWGGLYWQYFEDLDKITYAETPLKLSKKLYVKRNTEAGPVLMDLESEKVLVGDAIVVRIELRVDRDMEYVHMKDMRASGFEPVNVISGYRYRGGLGYYETTLDASTNFFFDFLRKGTYVFEYPLVASQKGDFSNGITSIQCLYAPEFTSHSEGVRVVVE